MTCSIKTLSILLSMEYALANVRKGIYTCIFLLFLYCLIFYDAMLFKNANL